MPNGHGDDGMPPGSFLAHCIYFCVLVGEHVHAVRCCPYAVEPTATALCTHDRTNISLASAHCYFWHIEKKTSQSYRWPCWNCNKHCSTLIQVQSHETTNCSPAGLSSTTSHKTKKCTQICHINPCIGRTYMRPLYIVPTAQFSKLSIVHSDLGRTQF